VIRPRVVRRGDGVHERGGGMLKLLRKDLILNWRCWRRPTPSGACSGGGPAMGTSGNLTFGVWSGGWRWPARSCRITMMGREDKFRAGALGCSLAGHARRDRGFAVRRRLAGRSRRSGLAIAAMAYSGWPACVHCCRRRQCCRSWPSSSSGSRLPHDAAFRSGSGSPASSASSSPRRFSASPSCWRRRCSTFTASR